MMIKSVKCVFVCFLILVLFCGCGYDAGSDENDTSVSWHNSPVTASSLEHGYVVKDGNVCYGFIYKNDSEKSTLGSPSFTITAYDENDKVVGADTFDTEWYLSPGEVVAFGSTFEVGKSKVAKVEFNSEYDPMTTEDDKRTVETRDLEITGTNERGDSKAGYTFLGEVNNNSGYTVDEVLVTVVARRNGKIVLADWTVVEDIKGQGKKPFQIDNVFLSKYDTVEYYAYAMTSDSQGYRT